MHGLINRSIQNFVTDSYGRQAWLDVAQLAELDFTEFEGMLSYDDVLTPQIVDAMCQVLARRRGELLEDFGTYLVSHPSTMAVRRLMRFAGINFEDFLHSLDDLPDRVRLALPDMILPELELQTHADGQFNLVCAAPIIGYGNVMLGLLRAMADEYGALVVMDHGGHCEGVETISIQVIETDFAEGRQFQLGAVI